MDTRELAKAVGAAVRRRRLNAGLTQDELAQMVGISRVTLSRYENGKRIPPLDITYQIADIVGTKLSELFLGID